MKSHSPNLFLTRTQFYENCTVGRLTEAQGHLICMTLEPRWRDIPAGQRWIRGKTCIAAGDYPLLYEYDARLKYQCWRLGKAGVSSKTRICFMSKSGSTPQQTQGDILLGFLHPEDEKDGNFEGLLHRPHVAFARLLAYYTTLRANHGDLVVRIEPPTLQPSIKPAVESPDIAFNSKILEDYILQTL